MRTQDLSPRTAKAGCHHSTRGATRLPNTPTGLSRGGSWWAGILAWSRVGAPTGVVIPKPPLVLALSPLRGTHSLTHSLFFSLPGGSTCAEQHLRALVSGGVVTWVSFQAEVPPQEEALASPASAALTVVPARAAAQPPAPLLAHDDASGMVLPPVEGATTAAAAAATSAALPFPAPPPWARVSAEEYKPGVPNAFHEGGRSGDFGAYGPTAARLAAELGRPPPRFLHFPLVDLTAPTLGGLKDMAHGVAAAMARHERQQDGGVVYLHCWGGKGRSGTVAGAVLASELLLLPRFPLLLPLRLLWSSHRCA